MIAENYITSERLRDIITGKIKYKKCLCCDNEGYEYWDAMFNRFIEYINTSD